jgi:hypothetical protein
MGRLRLRAAAGVVTSGRDAMAYGISRPWVVVASFPIEIWAPSALSESMNATTSAWLDVSR